MVEVNVKDLGRWVKAGDRWRTIAGSGKGKDLVAVAARPAIIMHHTAGGDTEHADTPDIRAGHLEKGWRDIGYHFVIERVGQDFVAIAGRPMSLDGAHCKGRNDCFGVALVGNFELEPVPAKQWDVAVNLVADLCVTFEIAPGSVAGHRDYAATLCPGKNFDITDFGIDVYHRTLELRKQR